MSSLEPRNISFGSNRARTPKSPAKRSKATPGTGRGGARWPPDGIDDDEENGDANDDDERTEGDGDERTEASGAGSYGELDIAIDHVKLYDWLLSWTSEYGIPGITPTAVFSTLCLGGTLGEWLTGIEDAEMPSAWADGGLAGMSPEELQKVWREINMLRRDPRWAKGIVVLSNESHFSPPKDKKK